MNTKMLDLLKNRNYSFPKYLIKLYKKLGLDESLLLVVIFLLNLDDPITCDYKMFAEELNMDQMEVMTKINELMEKKIIDIEVKKNSLSKLEEYINLDLFYNKLFLLLIDDEKEEENNSNNIYSIFERELGRTLSPIEYELINGWKECNYKEEIILAALKEAVYNGVNNFRYIDRILFEWNKKGIDSIDKIQKNNIDYKNNSSVNVEVPDYDWLGQNE